MNADPMVKLLTVFEQVAMVAVGASLLILFAGLLLSGWARRQSAKERARLATLAQQAGLP